MSKQLRKYVLPALVTAASLAVSVISADDRDLLRETGGEPYFFIILDTSGSMNWTPACSATDAATDVDPYDGMCTSECTMSDALCADLCPNKGCVDWVLDPNQSTRAKVLVDDIGRYRINDGPIQTESAADKWVVPSMASPPTDVRRENFSMLSPSNDTFDNFAITTDATTDRAIIIPENTDGSVTFRPILPKAGKYHVFTYIRYRPLPPPYSSNVYTRPWGASNARIEVTHSNNRVQYLEVDQRGTSSTRAWREIGTFDFVANASGVVRPSIKFTTQNERNQNVMDGDLYVDAIYLESVPDQIGGNVCAREAYRCTQPICPNGDCYPPLGGDDPSSKLFVAKSAIHEVINEVSGVQYGFGHYEMDDARVAYKHWMYKVATLDKNGAVQTPLKMLDNNTVPFPAIGSREVFGTGPPYDVNGENSSNLYHCNSNLDPYPPVDQASNRVQYPNLAYTLNAQIGCRPDYPADIRDVWEMDRISYIPKLGNDNVQDLVLYVRDIEPIATAPFFQYRTYKVTYNETSVTGADPDPDDSRDNDPNDFTTVGTRKLAMTISMQSCGVNVTSCGSPSGTIFTKVLYYDLISDYIVYNNSLGRYPMSGNGFFHNITDSKYTTTNDNDCDGLEDNEDWDDAAIPYPGTATDDDAYKTGSLAAYSFRWPPKQDSRGNFTPGGAPLTPTTRRTYFDSGDMVPLDWADNNRTEVMSHLAPNQVGNPTASPDFRIATYFHDVSLTPDASTGTGRFLRLRKDVQKVSGNYVFNSAAYNNGTDRARPILGSGRTPLANSLADFRDWFKEWKKYAEEDDIDWECRQKFVLFLTDGDETCSSPVTAACSVASELLNPANNLNVKTYVIGLGLSVGSTDALSCMATNGGTVEPFFPRNKDELVEALRDILDEVKAESRAFASASIPAVQSSAADKIYLSSFTPLKGEAIWPGRLDAFLEPLPLDEFGRPDLNFQCGGDRNSGCHLWDAANVLLSQAPTEADVAATTPDFRIGNQVTQRRVFYGRDRLGAGRSQMLRLLLPPKTGSYANAYADRVDLGQVLVSPGIMATHPVGLTEAGLDLLLKQSVGKILAKRELDVEIEVDGNEVAINCTGDPDAPNPKCRFVMGDIFHANPAFVAGAANFSFYAKDLLGYRDYLNRNLFRRRVLLAATNDGQVHAFDSGTHQEATNTAGQTLHLFNNGTGKEIFSYMPRFTMPAVREQHNSGRHVYSTDGSMTIADAYIDPVGTTPVAAQREWRTVVIGGVREGGDVYLETDDVSDFRSGYFALDLTTPDPMDGDYPATNSVVPGCLDAAYTGTGLQTTNSACTTLAGEQVPYPLELWRFQDFLEIETTAGSGVYRAYFADEDLNFKDSNGDGLHDGGYLATYAAANGRDLGSTWSKPVVAQIHVTGAAGIETKWVAIFGGGMDAKNKLSPRSGTWLYMVDMETGKAIYKRRLQGAAPAEPAAIDVDSDGVIDVIYIGTTAGLLYKVDLAGAPPIANFTIPKARIYDVKTGALWAAPASTTGVVVQRIVDPTYDPFPIVYSEGWPLYYAPAMFKIPELNRYAGLLLLGDRENLWAPSIQPEGTMVPRAVAFVDADYVLGQAGLPIRANSLQRIDVDDPNPTDNNLLIGGGGWTLWAPVQWRATGDPFLITGISVFTFFDPNVATSDVACGRAGVTYAMAIDIRNGSPLLDETPEGGCSLANCCGRCFTIDEFTTAIHADTTVTKNPNPEDRPAGGYANEPVDAGNVYLTKLNEAVRQEIMDLMPASCQYNDKYSIQLKVSRSLTGVNELARIPMFICPSDWKG